MHDFDPVTVNRLERQNAALISLARSDILHAGDLPGSLRKVAQVVSETLNVTRVCVWEYQNSGAAVRFLLQVGSVPSSVAGPRNGT